MKTSLNDTLKNKVSNAVELYKMTFPEEFTVFQVQHKEYITNLKDDWGTVQDEDGSEHSFKRELFRMPEKLYYLILNNLTDEESEITGGDEYAEWFTNKFPEFRVTKKY